MKHLSFPFFKPSWHLLLGLAFSASLLTACGQSSDKQGGKVPPPIPVSVIQVHPKSVELYSDFPGRISALEDAQVRARVNGIIQKINFQQGSEVKAGQTLFQIDPSIYQAQYDQAKAALAQAQASASSAQQLADRYASLVKKSAVSKQEYDNAQAQAAQANAAVVAAKASLELAQINLEYTDVKAPINGTIGKALVTVGALVNATQATHLATVQNFKQVYVDFTQSTDELMRWQHMVSEGRVQKNQSTDKVALTLSDGRHYPIKGHLLFSGVSVEPTTGQVMMRSIFDNPEHRLLPGMFVHVRLYRGVDPQALLVPVQAIQPSPDGNPQGGLLYTVDATHKVAAVKVILGAQLGDDVIIQSGLKPNETVIVAGFEKTGPGATVTPIPFKDGSEPSVKQAMAQSTRMKQ